MKKPPPVKRTQVAEKPMLQGTLVQGEGADAMTPRQKEKSADVYFSADVETDGPIPGPFSMLSFALVYAGTFDGIRFERPTTYDKVFYRELKPISEEFQPEALQVNGLIAKIADTYHAWRGDKGAGKYKDVAGFCRAAKLDEIQKHGHVLTPGRYVGSEEVEDDGEPFDQKMKRLVTTLHQQFAEGAKLEKAIRKNLAGLGFGGEA